MPEDYAPAIVAESTMALKTMSVASAVIELDTKDSPVFVFRNAGNDHVNIVYRRAGRQYRLDRPGGGLGCNGLGPQSLDRTPQRWGGRGGTGCEQRMRKAWISAI